MSDSPIAGRVLHDTLRELIQDISDRHGIQIEYVRVEWKDISTVQSARFLALDVRLESFARFPAPKSKPDGVLR